MAFPIHRHMAVTGDGQLGGNSLRPRPGGLLD